MSSSEKPASGVAYWLIRFGLKELQSAYEAARVEPDRDRKNLERRWEEIRAEVAAGETTLTQLDANGQAVYDVGEHLGEMFAETESILRLIREAFTITLHGFWERQVMQLMSRGNVKLAGRKKKKYCQADAFAFLKTLGYEPREDELNQLRLAANVAKHGAGNAANDLFKVRPDLFDREDMTFYEDPPSYDYLRITDEVLEGFFLAVRASCFKAQP